MTTKPIVGFKMRGEISHTVNEKFHHVLSKLQDQNTIYTEKDEEYTFANGGNIGAVFITATGGGGMGSYGFLKNGICYSGGGGGGSGSIIKKPVLITNPDRLDLTIKIKVGKGGGITENPDGGDTSVSIFLGEKCIFKCVCFGGKKAGEINIHNKGGSGAGCDMNCMYEGFEGEQGSITLSSVGKSFGGSGGSSAFSSGGGLGGYQKNKLKTENNDEYDHICNENNPCGLDGVHGAGGGGSVVGANSVGKGGSGFCMIEF